MQEHVTQIFKTLSQLPSREEFQSSFATAVKLIADAIKATNKSLDSRLSGIESEMRSSVQAETRKANEQTFTTLKTRSLEAIDALFIRLRLRERFDSVLSEHRAEVDALRATVAAVPNAGELKSAVLAALPAQEKETGTAIVDKVNALPTDNDEDKIDASHIKNLPQAKEVHHHTNLPANVALWSLLDVDASGINPGQALKWDGVRWIPFTPAGGSGTPVYNEAVSGSATTWTLAHTPVAGTLRLYANGQRLTEGALNDFTLSGTTITTNLSWSTGALLADYEY